MLMALHVRMTRGPITAVGALSILQAKSGCLSQFRRRKSEPVPCLHGRAGWFNVVFVPDEAAPAEITIIMGSLEVQIQLCGATQVRGIPPLYNLLKGIISAMQGMAWCSRCEYDNGLSCL